MTGMTSRKGLIASALVAVPLCLSAVPACAQVARYPAIETVQAHDEATRPSSVASQDDFAPAYSGPLPSTDEVATMLGVIGFVVLLTMSVVYLIPAIVAFARGHAYRWPIAALTLFGGWTALGWVAALVWSCWPRGGPLNPDGSRLDELERLARLRDADVITETEFEQKKVHILGL